MIPQCIDCNRLMSVTGQRCEAYLSGIPDAIWSNEVDHKQPYEDDGGLQFVQRGA